VAETVRTNTTKTTKPHSNAAQRTEIIEEVHVRSIRSDRLDVSVLRDLVAALNEADAPGRVLVEAENSDVGHLVQLRVHWSIDHEPAATAEAAG
jgi:hypothetical protein